jgi:TetR/AcrR family transcriptional repressor of nem operon
MPWEKTFDTSEAVRQAMSVFWEKGYVATSLADLIAATGVNKGSLYNAFGGKRDLFVQALLIYDEEHRRARFASLDAMDDPISAITSLFQGLCQDNRDKASVKGCFLVNTALDYASHDREVQAIITASFKDIEAFFTRQIAIGKTRSTIPTHIDPAVTAKALTALLAGMQVLARGIVGTDALDAMAGQALKLLSVTPKS